MNPLKTFHGLLLRSIVILAATLLAKPPLFAAGLSPQEAIQRMKVADGFEVKLVASEPEIRQPVAIYFDERGRLWVIQYLQYPNPEGLKPVKVDQYLRTVYDRVPEPPPKGPKGADRITICEDTDGDGRADSFKDFISGLNLASGLAVGHGGVFVMQPPYLLFYPDRNRDDQPDSDPEVVLSGFGMEDAHAVANSLQWGPDGWLYGAQGSTVTAHIRGLEFQQGIWRYHPITREFELFAEGGGNTWGLDFDEHGNAIAGTNFGNDIALHQVQGAYYLKNFGKHGELHNPYAFGYFSHIPYRGFKGGHVTNGGIVYQGGTFPMEFQNQYIAGNLLANAVYWHVIEPDGSSFKGHFGGELLVANDTWFRPVDCALGPDGAVYVADWYDKRATHVDPLNDWDRSNGRIYKIQTKGSKPSKRFDLTTQSSAELVGLLSHQNNWWAREARRILAERRDARILPKLRQSVLDSKDSNLALQSLWALYVSGGFDEPFAQKTLEHASADVRAWTIRLLGDARRITPERHIQFVQMAAHDPSPFVRNQLACTSKRLPGADSLPIVRELLHRDEDAKDPQIPLLLWWAIENKAISDRSGVMQILQETSEWARPITRGFVIQRLARRYAAEGSEFGFASCAQLLELAPGASEEELLIRGIEEALSGQRLESVPGPLQAWFSRAAPRFARNIDFIRLALRLGDKAAQTTAIALIKEPTRPESERVALIELLGQVADADRAPELIGLFQSRQTAKVQAALLSALQRFSVPEVADAILKEYPQFNADLRKRARTTLCGRPAWALQLLKTIEAGQIQSSEISADQIRQIALHKDPQIDRLVEKRWGKIKPESSEEKESFINQVKLLLNPSGNPSRQGKGNLSTGKRLYQERCGVCHTLFGEGNKIGPELTGADRKNTEFMLANIVNPSGAIRPEYMSYEISTKDDRLLTGLMVESSPTTVTLLDAANQRIVLARDQLKQIRESNVSLMPEGLLESMKPEEIVDFFSYLQANGP